MIIVRAIVAKEKPEEFATDVENSIVVWYDYDKHEDIAWANVEGPDITDKIHGVTMWERGFERALKYFDIEHEFLDLCFEDEKWNDYERVKKLLEEELYG